VIAACTVHIPLKKIPAHVIVIRDGKRLGNPPTSTTPAPVTGNGPSGATPPRSSLFLQADDRIEVGRRARFSLTYDGNRYRLSNASATLRCRSVRVGPAVSSQLARLLAVVLKSGQVIVFAGPRPREAVVLSPEMLSFATGSHTYFVVVRYPRRALTESSTFDRPIIAASAGDPALRVDDRVTYTALADRRGIRLNVWPFSLSSLQRATTPADQLPPYWADGQRCATGCAAPGVIPGWPLRPFHQQHAVRAGIDELRPANFHVAVDIEANNYEPVYAIQSGYASVSDTGSYHDTKVAVGSFTYWHIAPTVHSGQHVVAYKTEIGAVEHGFGHVAVSEGADNDYLNPLRPGGPLVPYTDSDAPVIGIPHIFADGRVIVGAFDPQSFIYKSSYLTPVLAPAGLAWRLYDAKGRAITGLQWALRSSGYISPSLKPVIFAPGAANPGFACFYTQFICIPNWVYNLAGGLTGPLPFSALQRGRYRLTIYAEDFKGNASALDYWLHFPNAANASAGSDEFGPLHPRYDP
jgi:hypothetical protein